jgi:hypothetical protein
MKSLSKLLLQLLRCSSGSALVETTITIPVAIALMAGGVDFGLMFSNQATIEKSLRDATRYLSRVPSSAICGWGLANAKNLAVYGTLSPTAATPSLIPGYDVGDVTLSSPDCSTALPNSIIIQLQANVPNTSIMLSAVGLSNSLTLTASHEEQSIGD